MLINPMDKTTNEKIDNLVRDLCKAHPATKSETRRRIVNLVEEAKREGRLEMLEKCKGFVSEKTMKEIAKQSIIPKR